MGGNDTIQIADFVVLYISNTLSRIFDPIQIGLYHIDGILYIPNSDRPKCSKILKKIIRSFKFLKFLLILK